MPRFEQKTAVVTGGGSGIGAATVRALHGQGASVVIVEANADAAREVAESLGDPGRVQVCGVDVSDRQQVERTLKDAQARFGRLDVLVNSAGIRGVASVMEAGIEQWRRVHSVNLEGTLNTCQVFARLAKEAGHPAAIVNVSSLGGLIGVPNRAPYVSSKHAVIGLTKEMAIEVGQLGIRVNAVAPGMIYTPMTKVMFDEPGGTEAIRRAHPIGREGQPEEVAAAILFLASDEASFVTGAVLSVDGGASAGKGW